MKKIIGFLLFGVLSCYAAPPFSSKLSKELQSIDPQKDTNVIVRWRNVPSGQDHEKVRRWGGRQRRQSSRVREAAYGVSASALVSLANDPAVEFIAPDRQVHATMDYAISAVNASVAWAKNANGSGVTVAVIDSGMNWSSNLGKPGKIVYSEDFTLDPNSKLAKLSGLAFDEYGHGQHVAGIIGADPKSRDCDDCTSGLRGIAPGVKFVNLKVLDANGAGTDSAVIAAIDRAIELKNRFNIRVINLSVGRPVFESYLDDPLCQAVEDAWKAGIVVVVAAGNDGRDSSMGTSGYGTINAPGNDPYVITVGAMKTLSTNSIKDDRIASYSSKGPSLFDHVVKPDIVAPGNKIISLLAWSGATLAKENPENVVIRASSHDDDDDDDDDDDERENRSSNRYLQLSGTSMATPVVTGAVAALLNAEPKLTPDQVKARLMLTANKSFPESSVAFDSETGESFLSYYDMFTVGAGYLDLGAAISNKIVAEGSAKSPTVTLLGADGIQMVLSDDTIDGQRSVWGAEGAFAARSVWGASSALATRSQWGASVVNGSRARSRSVWGADSVEGTAMRKRSTWGATITEKGEN